MDETERDLAPHSSSAVSSVIASVHHSLAELVRWSDKRLLYEDDTHNTQTVQEVVQVVREAVQVSRVSACSVIVVCMCYMAAHKHFQPHTYPII